MRGDPPAVIQKHGSTIQYCILSLSAEGSDPSYTPDSTYLNLGQRMVAKTSRTSNSWSTQTIIVDNNNMQNLTDKGFLCRHCTEDRRLWQ